MRWLRPIRSRVFNGAAAWFFAATVVWVFLLAPYAIDAYACVLGDRKAGRVECLKPVAQKLREDSNIATYATATVAAIIAVQLAGRNHKDGEGERRDDDVA